MTRVGCRGINPAWREYHGPLPVVTGEGNFNSDYCRKSTVRSPVSTGMTYPTISGLFAHLERDTAPLENEFSDRMRITLCRRSTPPGG